MFSGQQVNLCHTTFGVFFFLVFLLVFLMYATSFVVLQVCLRYYEHEFVELACQCPAVVCCRCSPTQKAQIVRLLQQHTANRTCAIGKR